jgi:hypothetical protein
VRVLEDVEHVRWCAFWRRARDRRFTATEGAPGYPSRRRRLGRLARRTCDEALRSHLAKERSPEALRLSTWVDRSIVFPARRERERLGIRRPAASDLPD